MSRDRDASRSSPCDEMLPLVEKLADGECSAEERVRAERHLEDCKACRAHLDFLEALPEAMSAAPPNEPPEGYWQQLPRKVMDRIERERNLGSGKVLRVELRWWAAVAAAVVVLVVGREVMLSISRPAPGPVSSSSGEVKSPQRVTTEAEDRQKEELEAAPPSGTRLPLDEAATPPRFARKQAQEASPEPAGPSAEADAVGNRMEQASVAEDVSGKEEEMKKATPAAPSSLSPSEEMTDFAGRKPSAEAVAKGAAGSSSSAQEATGASPPPAPAPEPPSQGEARLSSGESGVESDCGAYRQMLAGGTSDLAEIDVRYRLAECSIRRYRAHPDEKSRHQAIEDASSFLKHASEDPRAEGVRRDLEKLEAEKD